jgi:hypothetical protein
MSYVINQCCVNWDLQSTTTSFTFCTCSYPISLKNVSKVLEVVRLRNEFWAKILISESWRTALRAIICYGPGPRIITSPTKSPQDGIRQTDPLRCAVCISLELKSAWFQFRLFAVGTPNLTSHKSLCKELHCGGRLGAVVELCRSCTIVSQSLPSPTPVLQYRRWGEWNGKSVSASALNILAATLLR